jgi:hypothetical protein
MNSLVRHLSFSLSGMALTTAAKYLRMSSCVPHVIPYYYVLFEQKASKLLYGPFLWSQGPSARQGMLLGKTPAWADRNYIIPLGEVEDHAMIQSSCCLPMSLHTCLFILRVHLSFSAFSDLVIEAYISAKL